MPGRIAELKRLAPEIEFVPVKDEAQAAREALHADAVLGFCTPEIMRVGKLRWVQAELGSDLEWQLSRENVRRFALGETLLKR
jgi:hypothetical protein